MLPITPILLEFAFAGSHSSVEVQLVNYFEQINSLILRVGRLLKEFMVPIYLEKNRTST